MHNRLDWKEYSRIARNAAAEGCVLLRNKQYALPIRSGETVSVFGRIQLDYYKSGTGSGGMVNVPYVHSILDGLREHKEIQIYEPVLAEYERWTKEHPFDCGNGWGTEPWCQEEMSLTEAFVKDAAAHSDLALILIGRTAGEDRDNTLQEGSYYLTQTEREMLNIVCASFSRTAVVLNVGNIMDMSWVDDYRPSSVLYVWQGGMEGGCGAADVLCGLSPSGRLTDTIAFDYSDYPSSQNFGSTVENIYAEDIYVGYRYFETFAKNRVRYPFGFGLSYTTFSAQYAMTEAPDHLTITATITNTGDSAGKEVIQVYVEAPQGLLGKPSRVLCAFAKTETLQPGQTTTLQLLVQKSALASYDDGGATGHKSCYVLEAGTYTLYAGSDVRSAAPVGNFATSETYVTETLTECMAPVKAFSRMKPVTTQSITPDFADSSVVSPNDFSHFAVSGTDTQSSGFCKNAATSVLATANPDTLIATNSDGSKDSSARSELDHPYTVSYVPAPTRTIAPPDKRAASLPTCLPYTGDTGIKLADVKNNRADFAHFLAQLTGEDLKHIVHGEGMCSPKVTPGTAAAFGGITERLQQFGIPAGCCSDGPSGIRMDCGATAFSLPNGTLLASTFNLPLVKELFTFEGMELHSNHIDALLGPGINIHRNPLNGRNFEYHSEDPYLTGMMAIAQAEGMYNAGVSGTLKHFCCNNQEMSRHTVDSVVSERALREIYLKPFELCVRSGYVRSVMTSYNPVNGIWTAGNYDLNTSILRKEWGYTGMVMTDWWAKMNEEGEAPSSQNIAAMVRAQNDIFMVTPDTTAYEDNLTEALANGRLIRAELVRSAENICRFLMKSPAFAILTGTDTPVEQTNRPAEFSPEDLGSMAAHKVNADTVIPLTEYPTDAGTFFVLALTFELEGTYRFSLTASTEASEHAQMAVTLNLDGTVLHTYSYHGGSAVPVTLYRDKEIRGTTHYLKVFFSHTGLKLHALHIQLNGELPVIK